MKTKESTVKNPPRAENKKPDPEAKVPKVTLKSLGNLTFVPVNDDEKD